MSQTESTPRRQTGGTHGASERRPASVVLPTIAWSAVIEELGAQLGPADELVVVCDSSTDPIADREDDLPGGVRLVVAGEPAGCSGKANAVAAGIEAAENDLLVLTDDDYHHPPDWLDQLRADVDEHGPVSELPFFVGRDPLAMLFEPHYNVSNVLGLYEGDDPWGGTIVFDRTELDDEGALLADLRRTVSDDGVINDHLDFTTLGRVRRVAVGGSLRDTVERHVRFVKITFNFMPLWLTAAYVGSWTLTAIGLLLFPPAGFALTTLAAGATYRYIGVRRWTFLLAYPGIVLGVPLLAYAIARRTFVWGGRRYYWPSKFDVQIVGSS